MPLEHKEGPAYYKVVPIGESEIGRVWEGVVAQTGTDAPVVQQIYRNTLGYEIEWSRFGQGLYRLTTPENLDNVEAFLELGFQGDGQAFFASGWLHKETLTDNVSFVLRTYYNGSLSDNVAASTIRISIK